MATCVAVAEGVRGCSPRSPYATSLRGPQRRVVSALEASFLTVASFLHPSSLATASRAITEWPEHIARDSTHPAGFSERTIVASTSAWPPFGKHTRSSHWEVHVLVQPS